MLGAQGARKDVQSLQDQGAFVSRTDREDNQEVGICVYECQQLTITLFLVVMSMSVYSTSASSSSRNSTTRFTLIRVSPGAIVLLEVVFDVTLSITEKEDYTNLWCSLREQVSLVKSKRFAPGQGTFGHITGGYDAGYYGYVIFILEPI